MAYPKNPTPEYLEMRRANAQRLGWARRKYGAATPGSDLYPTYRSWQAMKRRCDSPKDKNYDLYGGRGISYDPRWKEFEPFLLDMGVRPPGCTLDRMNGDLGYSRENCRWATAKEQRANHRYEPRGYHYTLTKPRNRKKAVT